MNEFLKSSKIELSGIQKVAILLGELGVATSSRILYCLNLSEKEKSDIAREMKKLGKYNPYNKSQVLREITVLEDTLNYGKSKGIHLQTRSNYIKSQNENGVNAISDLVNSNPDAVADILKNWLEK